jgi:hypothetical protein
MMAAWAGSVGSVWDCWRAVVENLQEPVGSLLLSRLSRGQVNPV